MERLRVPAEFNAIFQRGSRIERASFVLLWLAVPGRRAAGFVAGRRLGGSASRNRARRRLREAYRRQKHLAPPAGYRWCFVARAPVLRALFAEVVADMAAALPRIGRGRR